MGNRDPEVSPAASYHIEVKGHLQGDWVEWFGGLTITSLANGNTALAGQIADQAALQGLINKVYALGLSLVAINQGTYESRLEVPNHAS